MSNFFIDTKLILATPQGFCAGVERAVDIVNKAIDIFGSPIYVKHEVVHNKYVIKDLEKKGVYFIEDIKSVPENSILIYSAHGVSIDVKEVYTSEIAGAKVVSVKFSLVCLRFLVM